MTRTTSGLPDLGPGPSRSPNEVPSPPGPVEHGVGAPSPVTALRRFGTAYINWDAAGVTADLRRLAGTAVGQARTLLALQAAQVGADPALTRAGVANHGRVESVAPAADGSGRWVVVTLERTSATRSTQYAGVGPAWHVALAGVSRRREGWVVSYWQIES